MSHDDASNDPTAARRARRAAERRAQILEGAVRVFREKGFQRATTRDIAEAAEVSEGTIYNYFKSKDDLLFGLLDHISQAEQRSEMLEAGLTLPFREFFEMLLRARLTWIEGSYDALIALLPEIMTTESLRDHYYDGFLQPVFDQLESHLKQRIERGESRDMDVALMVRLYTALTMGLQMLSIFDDPVLKAAWTDRDRLVEALTSLLFDPVMPPDAGSGDA